MQALRERFPVLVLTMLLASPALPAQSGPQGQPENTGTEGPAPVRQGTPPTWPAGQAPVDEISPFRENWILSELRSIRTDMMEYRNDMTRIVTNRELEVADKAMTYASSTVTYFFYLIAGAASLLALVGWSTIRDLKDKMRTHAETEMARLTKEYEQRLSELESELRAKSRTIALNQEQIELTNEIHNLWLKASKESSPQDKIAIYDRILELRPDDPAALAWKADAVLEMGEQRWALSLCDRVLEIDPEDSHALYQRACAWAGLGEPEHALEDLAAALSLTEGLREAAVEEELFAPLRDLPEFQALVADAR